MGGWDWWTYYEQPPEFIADIVEHLKIEALVRGKGPTGNDDVKDSNPDSIFSYKEKVS